MPHSAEDLHTHHYMIFLPFHFNSMSIGVYEYCLVCEESWAEKSVAETIETRCAADLSQCLKRNCGYHLA